MKRFGDFDFGEFFGRLAGPEGCDFKVEKSEKGGIDLNSLKWNCAGRNDKSFSEKILTLMGVDQVTRRDFLEWCHRLGGHCDCEIIFNVQEKALKLDKREKEKEKEGGKDK